MKDEEPMLLDAASLRLAWSGGTARAYRYTRLVMYEALRGEQAVELIEHAGMSKADRPAWQMCAAIDDTIVRVAAIAEDADAQTMAAMLAVQREARRRRNRPATGGAHGRVRKIRGDAGRHGDRESPSRDAAPQRQPDGHAERRQERGDGAD